MDKNQYRKNIPQRILFALTATIVACLSYSPPCQAAQRNLVRVDTVTRDGDTRTIDLYAGYHALVVGCGDYRNGWPQLPNPVKDAREVTKVLKSLGWQVDTLENPDWTTLRRQLNQLITGPGKKEDQAILFWFSGHGHTLQEAGGRKLGYIVPVNAPDPDQDELGFMENAISMRQIETVAKRIRSRHVLMAFDSCFSGSIFNTVRAKPSPYIQEKVARPVRQFIAAGNEDEAVPDRSVFKTVFIQGIKEGYADLNQDGYVTGLEIGGYLQEQVVNYTRKGQHPQFGKINDPKLDKGDFVFQLADSSGVQYEKPAEQSVLKINADVSGARVCVGTKNKGTVPVVLKDIEPGRYRVRITKAGYEDYLTTVEIQAGKSEEVRAFLAPIQTGPKPREIWTDPKTGVDFVWVPEGCFQMGQTATEKQYLLDDAGEEKYKAYFSVETPRHEVCLDGFWMGKTEITAGHWRRFVKATGYQSEAEKGDGCYGLKDGEWQKQADVNWDNPGFEQDDEHPVTCVSWNDAERFIQWANASGNKSFSLPTEAQWEYAARGGTDTIRFWGDRVDDQACRYANVSDDAHWNGDLFPCDDGYTHTAPVGNYRANPYGLHDMLGNVYEWVEDWKGVYPSGSVTNPTGPSSGSRRVIRGGSWGDNAWGCRSAYRYFNTPGVRLSYLGFRLARIQ